MAKHRGERPNQAVDAATVGGALAAIAALPVAAHVCVYFLGERTSIATLLSAEALVFGSAMLLFLHDRAIPSQFASKMGRRFFLFGCLLPVIALFANYVYAGDVFIWELCPYPAFAVWLVISATFRSLFWGGVLTLTALAKRDEKLANTDQAAVG